MNKTLNWLKALPFWKLEFLIFLVIFAVGVWVRWDRLDMLIRDDEGFSYLFYVKYPRFGMGTWFYKVYNYYYPNNHFFHTILMDLFYRILPESIQTVRMPVFLSSVGSIILIWRLGRRLNLFVGLLAALLFATNGWAIFQATDARGYQVLTFFALLAILGLIKYTETKKYGYIFLSFISQVLAIYTVPSGLLVYFSLLPFIGYSVFKTWEEKHERKMYAAYLILIPLAVLTLYAPPIHYLIKTPDAPSHSYIGSDLHLDLAIQQLRDAWALTVGTSNEYMVLHEGAPLFHSMLPSFVALALLILGGWWLRKDEKMGLVVLGFFFVALFHSLLIQKNMPPRTLSYALPFVFILISMGILGITMGLDKILFNEKFKPLSGLAITFLFGFMVLNLDRTKEVENTVDKTNLIKATHAVLDHWRDNTSFILGPNGNYSPDYQMRRLYMDFLLSPEQEKISNPTELLSIDIGAEEHAPYMENGTELVRFGRFGVARGQARPGIDWTDLRFPPSYIK